MTYRPLLFHDVFPAKPAATGQEKPELPDKEPAHQIDYADRLRLASCRKCFAMIVWARNTKTNARIPIDREPIMTYTGDSSQTWEAGMLVFREPELVTFLTKNLPPGYGERVYISHFKTCPFAAEFGS